MIQSSEESLAEVSYEMYPCLIEKSNVSTFPNFELSKKGQSDCFSYDFIKTMMTKNFKHVWLI